VIKLSLKVIKFWLTRTETVWYRGPACIQKALTGLYVKYYAVICSLFCFVFQNRDLMKTHTN